jgi:hypothetical protein
MKLLLTISIVVLSFGLVLGQGMSIGANVGGSYNMASSGAEDAESVSGIGFGGGVVGEMYFMPNMGVELDIMYAMYKYSSSQEIGGTTYDYTSTINNLVVPILFKYKMPMPTFSPNFALGLSIIKQMSGTYETSNGTSTSADVADSLLETDFGFQVGAAADLGMMAPMTISPYVRFQYNLTADDPDTDDSESASDILFGVNFMYKIK